jgi:HPt (histidine-containing phosphotransfer) domain-containing protein
MSKRHRQQRNKRPLQDVTGLGFPEQRARIESLLAAGKTREAVEAAKQCLKSSPGGEAEALLVTAYQARIRALMASGMLKEAQALGALISEWFPAYRDRVTPLMRQSEAKAGNFETVLAELVSAPPPRRQELEAILTR